MNRINRTNAYIGIAGSLTMAVSDVILLGQPVSGSHYDLSSFRAMENIDFVCASIGTVLGLISSFFICFGFWFLKEVFDPFSEKLSTVLFIALSSVMFFGGAFHAGYYFISKPEIYSSVNAILLNDFICHLQLISWLGIPGFLIGAVLFLKLSKHEQFPKWFRLCNPLFLTLVFFGVFYFVPEPLGGYLRPTFINLANTAVFVAALYASRKAVF